MKSEYHWNVEVRRADDDVDSSLPVWTADQGGCEGMQILTDENTSSDCPEGVPIEDALEQISLYQHADRRLPRDSCFQEDQ